MRVSLIVAMDETGVIGREGGLPWRLSADLRRFKELTMGHHLVMGRKTLESIGRILPGRVTIVLSRWPDFEFSGAKVAADWEEAQRLAAGDDEVFVIGGGQIYELTLPSVSRLYVTRVHAKVAGDTRFPAIDWSAWRQTYDERFPADAKNEYDYSFEVYDRLITGRPLVPPVDP